MVAVAELLAAAVLKAVLGKLASLAVNATWTEISLQLNFSEDLKSIEGNLSYIESFLKDAQRQSSKLETVRRTLKKLKAAAYDLEDMLLLFEYWTTTAHEGQSLRKVKKGLVACFERLKMPHKIKTMRETIDKILDLHQKFNFIKGPSTDDEQAIKNNRETTAFDSEMPVGRINEKESIISLLLTDGEPSIVPIYGIGGVGKTTLAQMVYNDDRTKDFFDVQAWVYVSVKFDLISIGTSIISQLKNSSGSTNNSGSDLQPVLSILLPIINNKRFLLVLDDIWEEAPLNLEKIKKLMLGSKEGSKILATTRLEKVAKCLNRASAINLDVLSNNYCWELFRAKALPPGTVDYHREIVGREIVETCKGIPLAVKSLGYLCLQNSNKWEAIRDSDIWAEDGDDGRLVDTEVLPSLKLSYQYMPNYLKSCFAYCAVFPKGSDIEKSSLIQQWIALGFVRPSQSFTAQQVGENYFEELLEMSFLQDAAGMCPTLFARYKRPRGVLFQMNGLVHVLARLVAGEDVISFDANDANRQQNLTGNTDNCRYMLISNLLDSSTDLSIPSTTRALHFKKCSVGQSQTTLKSLMGAELLRVLDLSACTISDLPDSIGNLRLLKFLNISGMQTSRLPKSLSSLHGLQALNLSENTCLVELPSYISEFVNLQYLDLHGCSNLEKLPQGIHKLKELLHLNVSRCGSLQSLPEQFGELRKLVFLDLSYCSQLQTLPQYFGGLQSLSFLSLLHCSKLHGLPDSFNCLTNMAHLNMSFCHQLKVLPSELFKRMKKLLVLNLSSCTSLAVLPEFCINNAGCQMLETLELADCTNLAALPDSSISLCELQCLNLSGCSRIQNLPTGLFKCMKKLLVLNLSGCTSLEGLPEFCNIDAGCRMLETLDLSDCTNLAALPDSSISLCELRCLNLSGCSGIQNFLKLIPFWKLGKLEYLNLTGVGAKAEAPGTSAGNAESSEDHNKEIQLAMLQEEIITRHLVHLRYLSVGGFTLFSEQGIARLVDLLTLPNFDVRTQPGDNHSNIMLLQQILDLTQHELNINCLENVVSLEEAKQVELGRKQQLRFLSLEWSSSDTGSSVEHERRAKANAVLEHLRPHKNLQCLSIKGYNGDGFPKWIKEISDTLPYLVKIVFSEIKGCDHIPTLGHLPNLQEMEINNMPLLNHVQIVSCKKLRKLTLVKLQVNATIHILYDDNTQAQVNMVGLIHNRDEEEIETGKEIENLPSSLPVNIHVKSRKAAAANFLVNATGFLKAPWHGMSRKRKRTQDIGSGNHSSAVTSRLVLPPGSSNERREQPAVVLLDYLKLESCEHLNFFPYVPVCKEYFIEDSSLSLGMLDFSDKEMEELDFCPRRYYGYGQEEMEGHGFRSRMYKYGQEEMEGHGFRSRMYKYGQEEMEGHGFPRSRTCKWESVSRTLRKLKITNCENNLIRRLLLLFTSLQELELNYLDAHDNDLVSTMCKMTRLEKLTIQSLVNAPDGKMDYFITEILSDIPYVNTRENLEFASLYTSDNDLVSTLCKMTSLKKLTIPSLKETGNIIQNFSGIPCVHTKEAIRLSVQATNSHSSNISVLFESDDHPKVKTLTIRNLENIKGPEEVGEGGIYRHYQELNSLSLMWSSENIDENVQDDPRTVVAILEKLRPPPSLSTLRLEGYYWPSAVCDWMKNLSSVLPNLVRIELAMCEQLPPLRQLDHLKILTFSHCYSLVELPDQIIRGCTSLKELEIWGCWNLAELPEWLGDLTSLTTLIIHAAKLERLPQSIRCLTSLEKLVLKECNYKLRKLCDSGQNVDIIQHVCLDISEGPDIFMSSSSITLLQKITSPHLHELNIKGLECVSSSEPKELKLKSKEDLHSLSLELSYQGLDIDVLEELQPHKNLKRLSIKNYRGVEFPNWMHSLQNLVRLELSNFQTRCLCLDHLQNLEDLHVSSLSLCGKRFGELDLKHRYDRSSLRISSMQRLKNLRRVTLARVGKLVWETSTSPYIKKDDDDKKRRANRNSWESSCQPSENIFPGLEYLEIDCCLDVRFQPSIPRSARYIISGSKEYPFLFNWPSFEQVVGPPTSASSSKMEIKHSESISSGPLDSLGQLDIEELTVDSCIDLIPLPECIRGWKSLQKIEIFNCENMETLPEWLGDMSSLRELKVETCWMQTLPPCIERLTSLQSLTLSKCTKKFKQRCSAGGDDWSKINKIKNLIVEERKR